MYQLYKNHKLMVLLLFFWVSIWASLNTYPIGVGTFLNSLNQSSSFKNDVITLVNFFRFYVPIVIFAWLAISIFKNKNFKFEKNLFINFYIIYIISQFLGLIFLDLNKFNFERVFLPVFALITILCLFTAFNFLDFNKLKKIFFVNIFFLILISIIYLPVIYRDYFSSSFLFLYNTQTWSQTFVDDPIIRVTGLARILALIFIVLIIKLNENLSKTSFIFIFFLLILIGTNIWGLQSRISLISILIIMILNLILFSKKIFLKNLTIYILIITASIYSFKGIQILKLELLKKVNITKSYEFKNYIINKPNRIEEVLDKVIDKKIEEKELEFITSARNLIWSKIINNYDYKKIFGYGPQADRFELLKEKIDVQNSGFMTNASSSIFYSFICGGYIGLLFFICLNIYILKLLFVFFKKKIYDHQEKFILNSIFLILIYIGMRSFVENSHAVFSLDFLILSSCVIILDKYLKQNKSNN